MPKQVIEAMDLLKFNKEIDRKILGSMRADNIANGQKKIFYGKDERVTPLQLSARYG